MSMMWIDLETTGLEPRNGSILEIALVYTDDDLNEIAHFVTVVKPLHLRGLEVMDDFVKTMHAKNGLLAELYVDHKVNDTLASQLPRLGDVEIAAVEWCTKASGAKDVKELRAIPVGGSSVHFDRAWLHEHMPALDGLFSHRNVDVSTVNELAKRWLKKIHSNRPGLASNGAPEPAHRALADIRASIEALRYYRSTIFNPAFAAAWSSEPPVSP